MSRDNYKVGYGRPPKHTRFVPGESGNKGRKKKRPEFQAEMVARIRDEQVVVNGASMTMFEMAIRSVVHNTIKRGHPRDLKTLLDLLEKYGAVPPGEAAADAMAASDAVVQKMFDYLDKTLDIDPADTIALDRSRAEEASLVMKCPDCSPSLRERWNLPERKTLGERYGCTGLQKDVEELEKKRINDGGGGTRTRVAGPNRIELSAL